MDSKQVDRAAGVLLASAAGDALGVPYEFGARALTGEPEQLGGGLGGFAPGEWSDDTSMACAIAQVAATGADLRTAESLDAIADGFLRWYADGPPDIGNQTRHVLSRATPGPGSGARMTAIAAKLHEQTGHTGGNGSLMRTGPVALAHLGDPAAIAQAARAVSDLTHPDPMAGDACALWCLAIDTAVRTSELDVRAGLPHVDPNWAALLDQAEHGEPAGFANNGWVVTALQASWSALTRTSNLRDALIAAVRAGNDTDTVAAITGALAGARYGGSTVPFAWRRRLHGWPGLRGRDLTAFAVLTARGGHDDPQGWPRCEELSSYAGASTTTAPHPDDPGVLLGAVGALQPGVADSVVSLCRLGSTQVPLAGLDPEDHDEAWIIDMEGANNDLGFAIRDAADAVHRFRAEGKTVLLHCVHAHTRTPVVAAAYSMLLHGTEPMEALKKACSVLPDAYPRPSIAAGLRHLSHDAATVDGHRRQQGRVPRPGTATLTGVPEVTGTAQIGASGMTDIDKDLARVKCATPVRDAIRAVAAAHRCQLYDGIPGSYVPLVSDPHTAVAIYANAGYIDFAVNPAQAQQWASRLGVTIVKPHQPTTNYVHVTTEQLAEATIRAQVVELAGTAFMHRAESSANPPSSEGSAGERAIGPTCTTCYEATSLTGVCGCNA